MGVPYFAAAFGGQVASATDEPALNEQTDDFEYNALK